MFSFTSEIDCKSKVQFGPTGNVIEEGMYTFRLARSQFNHSFARILQMKQ